MSTPAKIVALTASPSVWADLSFETGGIIAESSVKLGESVNAFDFSSLNQALGVATETRFQPGRPVGGIKASEPELRVGQVAAAGQHVVGQFVPDPADLYDSADLTQSVGGSELMSLRAEGIKAVLDKACALRANLWYAKYGNEAQIIDQIEQYYSTANNNSKPELLASLAQLAEQQRNDLTNQYQTDGRMGVVPETSSHLTATGNDGSTQQNGTQDTTYKDYTYRVPSIEANAQNARAQISLIDEQFAQFMAGQTLPNLASVFTNELTAIDMDVKRLQVAYLNTILLPPISGVVTGLYKQVGEAVLPGETVLRIEDNSTIYLVGTLICREMITLGTAATVTIQNLFSSAASATLTGSVIAARGDSGGDDRWNVVISCPNSSGDLSPVVPPNYRFDFDDTIIAIG